jgi:hypothetical protein
MKFTYQLEHAQALYCLVNQEMVIMFDKHGDRITGQAMAAQMMRVFPRITIRQARKAAAEIWQLLLEACGNPCGI